jgi:DNA-binding NtrC family response regulator
VPARVVLVHDDPLFRDPLATALRSAGHQIAMFADPLAAWDALEAAQRTELLITRVQFQPGRSNGIALARMARSKGPGIRIVFTALPEFASEVDEKDTFLAMPVAVSDVVETVNRILETTSQTSH